MPKAQVILHLDGTAHQLEVDYEESVLDAALDADLDPPYACMAGACTSCMAKLDQGEVYMEEDGMLDDEDKAKGRILCCQAKPRAEKLEISYE